MKAILVANWKNKPESLEAAQALVSALSRKKLLFKKVSTFIAPPLVYFEPVATKIKSFARLAAQDIFPSLGGPYTGSITPDILKNFGVRLAIIGHSERRALGETNDVVRKKVKFAMREGITALVCVGEHARDAEGEHFEFLREQLESAVEGLRRREDVTRLAIAYEPVWAIGKKASGAIDPKDLEETVIFIKKVLADTFGREPASTIPILYGGSVEPANARELMQATGINGFLVGRASLDAESFGAIAKSLASK
jgi:triosephosphate isomerase